MRFFFALLMMAGCVPNLQADALFGGGGARLHRAYLEAQANQFKVPAKRIVPLKVEIGAPGEQTRLVVPRKLAGVIQQTAALVDDSSHPADHAPTIIAGLALSLALVLGGLRLARKYRSGEQQTPERAVLIGASAFLSPAMRPALWFGAAALFLGIGSALVWARTAPPDPMPQLAVPRVPLTITGKIKVETIDAGEALRLILNPNELNIGAVQEKLLPAAPEGK